MKYFLLACLLLLLPPIDATAGSISRPHGMVVDVASRFIQEQTSTLSGKVSYKVEPLDSRISLAPCNRLEAFLPNGSQLLGKTSIGVRCMDANGWSILVFAQIKVTQELLVSARQLSLGHTIQEQDLSRQQIELNRPTGFTDPAQVVGKVLRFSIAGGQIIRDDMLRLPYSVTQGQIVPITMKGAGFSVRNEGVALGNAIEGQNVQVRVGSGRVVGGIAVNGTVEVSP